MRAGCAARSFFQFLVGSGENEKVDGVTSSVLVHGNGSCPRHRPIFFRYCIEHNPHTRMAGGVWLDSHEVFGIDRWSFRGVRIERAKIRVVRLLQCERRRSRALPLRKVGTLRGGHAPN